MPHNSLEPVKVVFLDRATLRAETVLREPGFANTMVTYDRTSPEEVAERIADAEIVIVNKVPLTAQSIAQAPRLRLVAVAATGYNNIDVEACRERGVVVSNIRGYAVRSVPEHVFTLIFALRRNLLAYRDAVVGGRWQDCGQFCFFDYPIDDLAGAKLGIVGGGELGGEVGRIAEAFGMEVQYAARKGASAPAPGRVDFATFLRTSDVITFHCPLTAETEHMISDPEFAAMERRPLLINTARGGLIDDEALIRALDAGRIAGAGIDAAAVEPPPIDHPLMRLAGRHDVIVTPHVGWASSQAVQALADQLVANLEAFVAGTPRNRVV